LEADPSTCNLIKENLEIEGENSDGLSKMLAAFGPRLLK
jgi:hypothetical protein